MWTPSLKELREALAYHEDEDGLYALPVPREKPYVQKAFEDARWLLQEAQEGWAVPELIRGELVVVDERQLKRFLEALAIVHNRSAMALRRWILVDLFGFGLKAEV